MIKKLHNLSFALLFVAASLAPAQANQSSGCLPTSSLPGLTLVNTLNAWMKSSSTSFSGTSAPVTDCTGVTLTGQAWIDSVTAGYLKYKLYDGATSVEFGRFDTTNHWWVPPIGGGTATLSSGTTTDLWSVPQASVTVSGTAAITALASASAVPGTIKKVTFSGALTLTHNGTSLILPGSANIVTAVGDSAEVEAVTSTNVRVRNYVKASGLPVVPLASIATNKLLGNVSGSPAAPSEITIGTGITVVGSTVTVSSTPMPGAFKNLSIKVVTTTTVAAAADFVTTTDGTNFLTTAVSCTIDLGSNGAVNKLDAGTIAIDTWYAVWTIVKSDLTTGCLASSSFTAPTMPTGYTYKARIGAVQTIHASATLYGTWQLGRRAQYVVGLAGTSLPPVMASGVAGTYDFTSPTLAAVTVMGNGKWVPPTASKIVIRATHIWKNGTTASVLVAPSTAYGGTNNGPEGSNGLTWPIWMGSGVVLAGQSIEMLLESNAIAWASDAAGGAIACGGWEDNL